MELVETAAPTAEPSPVIEPPPVIEPVEIPVDIGATGREAPHAVDEPEQAAPPEADGYDYLFGDTLYRGVTEAAVHVPDPDDEAVVDDALHDGETVMVDSIKKLRGQRPASSASAPKPDAPQALVLVMPNGAREALTQPILIGRSPTVGKVSGAIPRPVPLAGDDISRNHAQFTLEGGTVVVTDLHSRNGTSIVLPGKPPQKLRAGEPTSIIVGTIVDFGGGLLITVDEDA